MIHGDVTRKGRILCVTSNFPRWKGDNTTPFVQHLCEDLSDLGWQIDVLAPHASEAVKQEKTDKLNITRFQYFWPAGQQTVCYQGGALINLRNSFWNKLKLPFLIIAEFFAMFWLLVRNDYDLIHAHWILPQGFNAVILGKLFHKPVVITAHGGDVFGLKGKILTWFKRWSLTQADAVTANSKFTADTIKNIAPAVNNLHIISMGISIKQLSEKQQQKAKAIRAQYKQANAPLLIFVGRIVEEKGVGDLLQAVALLKKKLPGTRVLILGEGQDRNRFESLANELGITEMTSFKGWVDHSEVSTYLAAADFFVGPSKTAKYGWIEAQGLTFLEAMAVGTPVIATDSGGIKESIIDGETGFLVPEGDANTIAGVINSNSSNCRLLEILSKNARQTVEINFSRQTSTSFFSTLFSSVVSR